MLTIDTLLEQARANVAAKLAQRQAQNDIIEAVRSACLADSGREPNEAETAQVRSAMEARAVIDTEIEVLKDRVTELVQEKARDEAAASLAREFTPNVRAPKYDEVINRGDTKEPRTYSRKSSAEGVSWLSDSWHRNNRSATSAAEERILRHAREVEVEGEIKSRAASTGSFAGLIPPQYLVDLAAPVLRAGRPFANSIGPSLQLPDTGMTFQIPRGATGASVAVQSTENSSVSSTDEVWANLTLNVATVAGQQDVSRQTLDRGAPGTDELVFMDLAGAYGVGVDKQVLSGSGASGQVLGVLNTSGVNQASPYGAAVTPATFYTKNAGGVAAVEANRFLPPDHIAMHPNRWMWLLGQTDSSQRPLAVPNASGPFNAIASVENNIPGTASSAPMGLFLGLPVLTDASIPTAVGTGPEDQVIIYRAADLLLWEDGDGMPQELRFEQTLGNQLTVKLVVAGYIAFTAGRYPAAVSIIGGNAASAGQGQIAPTF